MARRAEEIRDPYFSGDEVNIRITRRAGSEYGRLLSRFNERTRRWKEKMHEKFRRDVNALFRCLRFQERLEVYRCRSHWKFRIAIAIERDEEEAETSSDSDGGLSEDEVHLIESDDPRGHETSGTEEAEMCTDTHASGENLDQEETEAGTDTHVLDPEVPCINFNDLDGQETSWSEESEIGAAMHASGETRDPEEAEAGTDTHAGEEIPAEDSNGENGTFDTEAENASTLKGETRKSRRSRNNQAYGVFRGMGEAHRSRKSRKVKVNVGGSKSMEPGSKHAATSAELRDRLMLINEKIDRKMSEIQEIKTTIHEFDEGFYTLAWLSLCFKSIVLEIPDIGRPFQVHELQTRIKEELKNIFPIDPERYRLTEAHLMDCLGFTTAQILKQFGLIATQGSCYISVIERNNTPEDVDRSAVLETLHMFRAELINLESQKENMEKDWGAVDQLGK